MAQPCSKPKYFTGYWIKTEQLTLSLIGALILKLWLSEGSEHLDAACRKLRRVPPGGRAAPRGASPILPPTHSPEWVRWVLNEEPFSLGHFSRLLPAHSCRHPPVMFTRRPGSHLVTGLISEQQKPALTRPRGSSWFLRNGGSRRQAGFGSLQEGLRAGGPVGKVPGP